MSPHPTYAIRTVADFLLVPEDRLDECLREFRICVQMARASMDLLNATARGMDIKDLPEGDLFAFTVFRWIDDDAGNITVNIGTTSVAL